MATERTLGVATTKAQIELGTIEGISKLQMASGSTAGFYGTTAIAKPSVTQQTTKTTTALRADIDRINTVLSNLGLITVT